MKRKSSDVTKRFVYYTSFDSQSDPSLSSRPTTACQEVLLKELKKELEEMGYKTYYGKEKVVYSFIPGDESLPCIGFMAHVDTASDCKGNGVKAKVHKNYDGSVITLKNELVLDPEIDKDLSLYIGDSIITSDGTTLLGSDDKAGVAIIMEIAKYYSENKELKHPPLEIFFTPDEETGCGMDMFPFDKMKSKVCYTIDGAREGEVEDECFNAATMKIRIEGRSIHLGDARGRLVNAVKLASVIISSLPGSESPEATDGRYGYYCPLEVSGSAEEVKLNIYIRDFDSTNFEKRMECVRELCSFTEKTYGGKITIDEKISYRNMKEGNDKNPKALEKVFSAAKKMNYEIKETLIRGGTDGARLSEKGIASPNLPTGGHNLHSLSEWVSEGAMNRTLDLCLKIIEEWAE